MYSFSCKSEFYARGRARDLARDKCLAAALAFMIEENAVAGKQAVRLAVVHGDVIRIGLRAAVWRARMKRRLLGLRHFMTLPNSSDDEAW